MEMWKCMQCASLPNTRFQVTAPRKTFENRKTYIPLQSHSQRWISKTPTIARDAEVAGFKSLLAALSTLSV